MSAKIFHDCVQETTTTTGTGAIVLAGVVEGFRPFSLYSVGQEFYYAIRKDATEWENGVGVRTSTGFTRTPSSSSNGNALVNFSAGTKEAFVTVAADYLNGYTIGDLPASPATIPDAAFFEYLDPATGLNYKVTYAALKAAFGGSATPADTTAPVLSAASAAATGTTTATASVTTNEGAGTLYCLISTASTATAAQVKAGLSQAVTSTGAKTFNRTGLTAATTYYPHFLQVDAAAPPNESAVLTGASFQTQTAAVAATGVTLTGPTTGAVSVQSTNFTVGVTPVGGTISGTVVVTPSDNGGGGTFSPTTVSLTAAAPTATFKYTPSATAGARSITVTNNGSLTNPAPITYTSTAGLVTYTGITGYNGNAIRPAIDTATTAPTYNGTVLKGYVAGNKTFTLSGYWDVKKTPGGVDAPLSGTKSGWSTSATVPPTDVTSAQNRTSGDNSVNGYLPMSKPSAAFIDDTYVWVPAAPGTYRRHFWIKPSDGADFYVGFIDITVV